MPDFRICHHRGFGAVFGEHHGIGRASVYWDGVDHLNMHRLFADAYLDSLSPGLRQLGHLALGVCFASSWSDLWCGVDVSAEATSRCREEWKLREQILTHDEMELNGTNRRTHRNKE